MRLPVVSTSLSCTQKQSKPIGFPKALLCHVMDGVHNHLSNLVSGSTQSFLVAQLWCGMAGNVLCDSVPTTNKNSRIAIFRSCWFEKERLLRWEFTQGVFILDSCRNLLWYNCGLLNSESLTLNSVLLCFVGSKGYCKEIKYLSFCDVLFFAEKKAHYSFTTC